MFGVISKELVEQLIRDNSSIDEMRAREIIAGMCVHANERYISYVSPQYVRAAQVHRRFSYFRRNRKPSMALSIQISSIKIQIEHSVAS